MEPDQIETLIGEGNPNTTQPEQPAQPVPPVDYNAIIKQQQEQLAAQSAQLQQLMQTVQTTVSRPTGPVPPPVDPYAGFDEATAKALRAVNANLEAKFNAELAARDARLAELQVQNAMHQIASANPNVANPAIIKRAQELYKGLSRNGVPLNAEDSYKFALGEAVVNGTYVPNRINSNGPTVLSGGSSQPNNQFKKPANYENLPYKEQIKILETTGELDAEF